MSANKSSRVEDGSSNLVQLPYPLLRDLALYLVLDDIIELAGVCIFLRDSLKIVLGKTFESFMTIKILEAVVSCNTITARKLITVHPQFILQKAPVTDHSGRKFFCTPVHLCNLHIGYLMQKFLK